MIKQRNLAFYVSFFKQEAMEIIMKLSKRDLLTGVAAMALSPSHAITPVSSSFNYKEILAGFGENHHVAEGYNAEVLIRWGDAVEKGADLWSPETQSGLRQAKQFGYNNDFLGYFPIKGSSKHGLLCVNHEYTNEELMFSSLDGRQDLASRRFDQMTKELIEIEMMAHGGSVVEVLNVSGKWTVVSGSKFARRITAETPIVITGPAAGHARMKTSADASGRNVLGMINNCSGGKTPWGTWLSGEENFNGYFWAEGEVSPALKRYGVPRNRYAWGKYYERFNLAKEPNEINRFGWIVEIDPHSPQAPPKKRTALGRFKHEGAAGIIAKDGRYVVFMGDDERYEYIYRFITKGKASDNNPDLLDEGTLSVAHFRNDNVLEWRDLVFGQGALTPANGFHSQADISIETRRAGDLVGATKMDRPEDVEPNPKTGKVYAALTNNFRRKPEEVDKANSRANNRFGHIIEMTPPNGDHTASTYTWESLVLAGDPSKPDHGATFNKATTHDGWFLMPDNIAFDPAGRMWVATDGNQPSRSGRTDGLFAMETEGALRGTSKSFFRVPLGAEMCGPDFTPDGETLFLAVQHPGEADEDDPKAKPTHYMTPATRWPDFKPNVPPRPSVVVVTKKGGGKIGG
jgi:uncharacterized protein